METKERKFHLHNGQTGAAITIRVTPRSRENQISEIMADGTVKVRLIASGPDDKLNSALLEFLAGLVGVKPTQLEIVAGASGMDKLVTITGLPASQVQKILLKNLAV